MVKMKNNNETAEPEVLEVMREIVQTSSLNRALSRKALGAREAVVSRALPDIQAVFTRAAEQYPAKSTVSERLAPAARALEDVAAAFARGDAPAARIAGKAFGQAMADAVGTKHPAVEASRAIVDTLRETLAGAPLSADNIAGARAAIVDGIKAAPEEHRSYLSGLFIPVRGTLDTAEAAMTTGNEAELDAARKAFGRGVLKVIATPHPDISAVRNIVGDVRGILDHHAKPPRGPGRA